MAPGSASWLAVAPEPFGRLKPPHPTPPNAGPSPQQYVMGASEGGPDVLVEDCLPHVAGVTHRFLTVDYAGSTKRESMSELSMMRLLRLPWSRKWR